MTKIYAGVAVGAVAALLGGSLWFVFANRAGDTFADCRTGQVAGGAIGGPFTLVNSKGDTVTEAQVLNKPALVYFGYTYCPDVCPMDMARNVEAVDILEERGFEVTPVFISIDPERDTPEVMGEYVANLHPRLVALTGTPDQTKAASLAYKTFFEKQPSEDEFYLMNHSTFTYLMLPGVGFVDFFKRDLMSDQLADSVSCFLGASESGS